MKTAAFQWKPQRFSLWAFGWSPSIGLSYKTKDQQVGWWVLGTCSETESYKLWRTHFSFSDTDTGESIYKFLKILSSINSRTSALKGNHCQHTMTIPHGIILANRNLFFHLKNSIPLKMLTNAHDSYDTRHHKSYHILWKLVRHAVGSFNISVQISVQVP